MSIESAQVPVSHYNTAEAAQYLGQSVSTLTKLRVLGKGPRYLKMGGTVRYRRSDLDKYMDSCVVETADTRAARCA